MKSTHDIFVLLDGNSLLHRAWHAIPPLTTKDGRVVNAAYGFAVVLDKMLEQFKPTYMAVAWDLPGKTFRHEQFPAYKAQREEKAQELYDQIPLIQDILAAYGIPSLSAKGYEADDVIATLAAKASAKKLETFIVTGDLDSLQLVDDTTKVVTFQKGISETKTYDVKVVQERYGLSVEQLVDYKALRGDPSDNIPGVPGVGEKTATELLQKYGTIKGIFQALKKGAIPEKYAKKLEPHEQTAEIALGLVTAVRNVPLTFRFTGAKLGKPDAERLTNLYRDLEFRTLLKKYAGETPPPPMQKPTKTPESVVVVRGLEELEKALSALAGETIAVLIADQPADLFGSTLAAVAVSDGQTACVVPNPTSEHLAIIMKQFGQANVVVTHDLKRLMRAGDWRPDSRFVDLMIASYLLHSGSRSHDLPAIAHDQLKRTLPEIPAAFATQKEYAALASIAVVMPALWQHLSAKLDETGMRKVFGEIEMPLIPILHDMESAGIELDTKTLVAFSGSLKKRVDALATEITKLAGDEVNINSPLQLATVLFTKLKLPTKGIKRTTHGYSTAASELEKLADAHPIIPLISEYRELAKLQSTYVEALPALVHKDGRIHTTFNQTVTATGRLSSSNPNLQNIPIRTELGNEIRKTFVASKGHRLIAADYSQIELRLAVVIAKDQPFIQAFREGADIHTRTASEILGIAESEVTPNQRRAAKAINFGIMFGMGPRALARSTGMKFEEAQDFIARYFDIHKALHEYMDATKLQAHQLGYVETLFGRRRYLPEIASGVPQLVAAAERMAINMPVQGTEADILKMAMIALDGWLKKSGWPARLLLQVHDELVVEVKQEAVDAVAKGMKEIMEGVAQFEVPLEVDVEVGKNWGEMEHWAGSHEQE